MPKTRYTASRLAEDIAELNKTLERMKHPLRFVIGGRYGHSAIDMATPEQISRHVCERNLALGTPRECLNECHAYIARNC